MGKNGDSKKALKPGKAAGSPEVCAEIILASEEVETSVTMEPCRNGKRMLDEWQTSVQGKRKSKKL